MLTVIITLNGKAFMFISDDMDIIEDRYVFYYEGATVGSFWVKGIAGYFTKEYEEDEDEEEQYP